MAQITIYASASSKMISSDYLATYSLAHNLASGRHPTGPNLYVAQYLEDGKYNIDRSFIIFNTSAILSGATIDSVVLQLYSDIKQGDLVFDVVVRNGQPTYPHIPVLSGDFLYSHYSGDGGSINVKDDITLNTWNDLIMNATGRGWIQKAGTTKLALISSKDISSTAPTSSMEQIRFTSIRMVINYSYAPATVTAQAVSDIDEITATGNGNITDIGGVNPTKRGICWSTSINPDVNDNKSEEIGSFGTGAFSRPMTGLLRGQKYYVKAYAYNLGGYSYSSEVEFYTKPSVTTYAPTDIIRADPTKVTANGLIDLDVVEPITTRGFKYGLTETDTWNKSETGSYGEGAFSLQITGLTEDTTYYICAYATGLWGTKLGPYLQFRTAYHYGSTKIEIKSEAIASEADIAAVGGKRSKTIENHLIQTQTIADLIANAYLAEYKDQKTKLVITRPTPAPYEIGDTIKRFTKIPYRPAKDAVIGYKPAKNGKYYYEYADYEGKDMIIRKINLRFSSGNYISIIELED
ncbi:hypothetical protein ES705_11391 [subsurface metagenome]